MAKSTTTVELNARDKASTVYKNFSKNASKSLKNVDSSTQNLSKNVKMLGAGIAVALGSKAIGVVKDFAAEVHRLGIETTRLRNSSQALSMSMGKDYSSMVAAAKRGTQGLVSEFTAMQEINKGLLLDLPITAANMDDLAETAVVLGRAMNRTADEALSDLITGLSRGSALILDNIGIQLDQTRILDEYAKTIGVTAKELDNVQKKQAIFNAALEESSKKVKEMGGIQRNVTVDSDQIAARWQDVKRDSAEAVVNSGWYANVLKSASKEMSIIEGWLSKITGKDELALQIAQEKANTARFEQIEKQKTKEFEAETLRMAQEYDKKQAEILAKKQRELEIEELLADTKNLSQDFAFLPTVDTGPLPQTGSELTGVKLEEHDLNALLITDYNSLNEEMMRNNELTWTSIQLKAQEKEMLEKNMIAFAKQAATTFGIQSKFLVPIEIYEALKQTGYGIAALSPASPYYNPPAAPLHFTSALKHISAAKALSKGGGAAGAGGAGGGAAGGGGNNFNFNPNERPEFDRQQNDSSIIINNTLDDTGFSTYVEDRSVSGIIRDAQNGGRSIRVIERELIGAG